MFRKKIFFALLVVALLLGACNPRGAPQNQATEQPASVEGAPSAATVPPLAASAELSFEQIKNADYQPGSNPNEAPVKLSDGVYQRADQTNPMDIRVTDFFVSGDLNGDLAPDMAVIFYESYGGSGTFVYLVIYLNQDGQPHEFTALLLGDREQVNWINLEGANVVVDLIAHGPIDPMASPTQPQTRTYQLTKSGLVLIRQTSKVADDKERIIAIESPAAGSEVSGSVQIMGSVTIAPFESTLAYRIYDNSGAQIAAGSLMVNAPDMGAAGTFDTTIDLTGIPAGAIRIELLDLSAADGSILAMDSLDLIVK
jgi:hypothetical protein